MHKYTSLTLLCMFLFQFSYSQTIKIINKQGEPIEQVAIFAYKKTQAVLSNKAGEANLQVFTDTTILTFQHPSYIAVHLQKNKIKKHTIILKDRFYKIAESVVSAYGHQRITDNTPNSIITLTPKEVTLQNPQTTADLVGGTYQVYIQKSQLGGGSPMIRGFATSSVLIMLDGIRINNAIFRSGNVQNIISLDPNTMGQSKITLGPQSVNYGSDALGGVMDFQTLNPELSTSDSSLNRTYAFVRFSSATNEFTTHLHSSYAGKTIGGLTSISYSAFRNLQMGSHGNSGYQQRYYTTRIGDMDTTLINSEPNKQKHTNYSQINLMQKIRYEPSTKTKLIYGFHYSQTSDIPRYDRLIQYKNEKPKYADWHYGPQKWMMHAIKAHIKKPSYIFDQIKIIAGYQFYQESRIDRKFQEISERKRTEKVNAIELNTQFEKKIWPKHQLYYGTSYVFNNVDSKGTKTDILTGTSLSSASRYPNGINHYTQAALFAAHKFMPTTNFVLSTGIRYSHIWSYSSISDNQYYHFPFTSITLNTGALNGSIGFVYKLHPTMQLHSNLSSGFHAPNIDDLAKIFDSQPGSIVVPNPNLKPEYAYNWELGIEKNWDTHTHIEITGFITRLENAMVRQAYKFNGQDTIMYDDQPSKVTALVNSNYANLWGFHASWQTKFNTNHQLRAHITYTDGYDSHDNPLRHVPPLFGTIQYQLNINKAEALFYMLYNGKITADKLALSERSKTHMYKINNNGHPYAPAWVTFNVKTSVKITKMFTLQMGIENILDSRYRPYSSGIVAPGRNFIIALRGKL